MQQYYDQKYQSTESLYESGFINSIFLQKNIATINYRQRNFFQMKNTFSMLLILVTSLLSMFGCHKEKTPVNISASEYFPNTVGDIWVYDVYDSSSNYPNIKSYTVKVSIKGVKKMADGIDANIWEYEYPWGKDTNYVRVLTDTISIFENAYSSTIQYLQYPGIIYIVPFQDRSRWNGMKLGIDTFHVNFLNKVVCTHSSFYQCYQIYHHYLGPNIDDNNTYWFKPNIGIVKKYKNIYNLGPYQIALWELKSYYLK